MVVEKMRFADLQCMPNSVARDAVLADESAKFVLGGSFVNVTGLHVRRTKREPTTIRLCPTLLLGKAHTC